MISYVRNFLRTTESQSKYWRDRKIDWKTQYFDTWNHPHRQFLSYILKSFPWVSLLEVGCGGGANLAQIVQTHGDQKQLGGTDVSESAIAFCQSVFKGAFFKVCGADDLMMSDSSVDVILSDMALIYVDRRGIDKAIKEMKRVARKKVVICEFHSESLWERLKIKFTSGYNVYDYTKLLEKHGFYDVIRYKLPKDAWPGGLQEKVGYVIVAKVPRRK